MVGSAFGKKCLCAAYTGASTTERAYAHEQFGGNVYYINRHGGRKREREREGQRIQGQERGRLRKMEKGMYVRWNSWRWKTLRRERERERESNSRYNFGAPRKLKLLRAEHAELSAVFLLGTIRIAHPFLHFLYFHRRVCPRYAHRRHRRPFHEGLLLLILSEVNRLR